ncbi:hypothetical protein Pyn_02630 [Prunus yedoensis var. nudiflora]|uniref:Secreted protein n=1 Tax=Prunus yedoensis var. nudiflora TaxID=2094558 RepID=A0A315AC08_PRUYE|nr:hypothetical protein Pyn_02630 [Prunus yedoensis var. nudiflora]
MSVMLALLEYLGFSTIFVCALRASPAQQQNWATGPLRKPKAAPALQPVAWFGVGPTSPGKPKGRFRLCFSPRAVTSTLTSR